MRAWETESLDAIHKIRQTMQREAEGMSEGEFLVRINAAAESMIHGYGLKARKPAGDSFAGLLVRDRGKSKKPKTGR